MNGAIPGWLRTALLATAAMNVLVGLTFAFGTSLLGALAGLPLPVHPFWSGTVAIFITLFGFGYLGAALSSRPERLVIALGGAGKLLFVALVTALWMAGELPGHAPLVAGADLPFGLLFVGWILTTRGGS